MCSNHLPERLLQLARIHPALGQHVDSCSSTHKLYETVDGPHKRKHWLVSLPAALSQFVSHLKDLDTDYYEQELTEARAVAGKYEPTKFHNLERVRRRFSDDFLESYMPPPGRNSHPGCCS